MTQSEERADKLLGQLHQWAMEAVEMPRARRDAFIVEVAAHYYEDAVKNGLSASQFARDKGLSLDAVKEVLNGRSKANFGKAHAAAVALGMKPNPEITTLSHKVTRRG